MRTYGGRELLDAATLAVSPVEMQPYHDGKPKRSSQVQPELREFVAWDGEGRNLRGKGKPQSYILFGCSTGERLLSEQHIPTNELLAFIVEQGRKHPTAFHVAYSFGYDVNMILQTLPESTLKKLHKNKSIMLRFGDARYRVSYLPGKIFTVTAYGPGYHHKTNTHDKTTVTIYDIFTFFAKSFVAAYEEIVGPVPDTGVLVRGKAGRDSFEFWTLAEIDEYWREEIVLLRELATELRKRLYGAGLRITQWHGPGALASFALRQRAIQKSMAKCPEAVRKASKYAYAGGRFEMFRLGRVSGPIYAVDINSAYPFGLTKLPDLNSGEWRYVANPQRGKIARFGVYRVRLNPVAGDSFLERAPGPLFHRDKVGNISFPWVLEGWYWSPEVYNLTKLDDERWDVLEGWEYLGASERPFDWIAETYALRQEWKAKGIAAQLALKLLMNSIYGKLAQRVGWNEEKREAPRWHQLEWAGWVTSHCRAMMWDLMSRVPRESIIAVETDGMYMTTDPRTLGIEDSKELGRWEVKEYDEILYVQSGMAWLRKGSEWTCKRRGLDAKTFSLGDCESYLNTLAPREQWPAFKGTTRRFIGVGTALLSAAPFKLRHCVWVDTIRDIRPGHGGKRIHVWRQCRACAEGLTAYQGAHDMSIKSLAYQDPMSHPHDLPWDNDPDYPWRTQELEGVDYAEG